MERRTAIGALAALASGACARRRGGDAAGRRALVFKHQPLWGDPGPFRALLAGFERENPGLRVETELLPNAADVLHQYFLTSLEGRSADFDVFVIDVVWVREFARAGWIADLSSAFPAARVREDFLPGPASAVTVGDRVWAVPWFVDVGLLYYRSDLVPAAPATYDALVRAADEARRRDPGVRGYLWQARQYEGLVCNAYESVWGHGGGAGAEGARVVIDTPAAREGLAHLRALIERGTSPPSVTSAAEEECRRTFQDGRAAFMRNWPYAWAEFQSAGSRVRGRVAVAPLPTATGEPGAGALGGWQLAVNARAPAWRREAALRLVAHLTSHEANVAMAVAYARNPPRRAPYADPRLAARAPFIASLGPALERARPRPVTPYYSMITDVLQSEFSAAVAGVRAPAEALRRAQALVDHVTGGGAAS